MSKKRSAETGRILSRDGKDPLLLGFGCKRVRGFDGFNFSSVTAQTENGCVVFL